MQHRLRFIGAKGVHSDSQLSYLFFQYFGLDNGSTLNYTDTLVFSLFFVLFTAFSLFPFGLGGGACMLIVLVDIVLPWRGEDIEDACRSLRDNT